MRTTIKATLVLDHAPAFSDEMCVQLLENLREGELANRVVTLINGERVYIGTIVLSEVRDLEVVGHALS